MADAMDCGFNWPDHGGTFTFGFATNDAGSWEQRPGSSDTINANHELYFSFFELTETDPDKMKLESVTITFALTEGDVTAPILGWPAASGDEQSKTYEVEALGQANGFSAGLQEHGTAWSLGPFSFNPALQQEACTYEVSICATVKDGTEGPFEWSVDPEMVIGPF